MGLIDTRQRLEAEALQASIVEMVRNKQWRAARTASDELLAFITAASASATLEDVRRDKAYDAEDRVTTYLNLPGACGSVLTGSVPACLCSLHAGIACPRASRFLRSIHPSISLAPLQPNHTHDRTTPAEVKANINARPDVVYAACSPEVDRVMGHDVMKSVARLVPDLLARSNVLLYQGQWDAECGVASNEAWISKLAWPGHTGFHNAERKLWRDDAFGTQVLGFIKSHRRLSHVVIRNAGHMVSVGVVLEGARMRTPRC